MNLQQIEYKLKLLPDELIKEVDHFIDFLIKKSGKHTNKVKREPGFLAGKIKIKDNFDEPLKDFEEYM